jgi:hypothetical protein
MTPAILTHSFWGTGGNNGSVCLVSLLSGVTASYGGMGSINLIQSFRRTHSQFHIDCPSDALRRHICVILQFFVSEPRQDASCDRRLDGPVSSNTVSFLGLTALSTLPQPAIIASQPNVCRCEPERGTCKCSERAASAGLQRSIRRARRFPGKLIVGSVREETGLGSWGVEVEADVRMPRTE